MIAAGLGCRKGCARSDALAAVHAALAHAGRTLAEVDGLYIPEFKRDEHALHDVARELAKPLRLLSLAALQAVASRALTSSQRVQAEFRLPSIAETAALAGAGLSHELALGGKLDAGRSSAQRDECANVHGHDYVNVRREGQEIGAACRVELLGPRVVVGGATCALAVSNPRAT